MAGSMTGAGLPDPGVDAPEEVVMRLDGVEIKVSIAGEQTRDAVEALGLPAVDPWHIFFLEDVTAGLVSSTPLLDQHLILRARQKSKGADDVTVKLRPGRRSQLGPRWLGMSKTEDGHLESELKVEEDWAGERRSLAISLTAERPDGLVAALAAGDGGVSTLLTEDQQRFVEQCSGLRVDLDVLSPLPPVSAMRWPTFTVPGHGGADLEIRAERWTVLSLDFLELSISVGIDEAEDAQRALHDFVASKHLRAAVGEAKTSQVMQVLVASAAALTPS